MTAVQKALPTHGLLLLHLQSVNNVSNRQETSLADVFFLFAWSKSTNYLFLLQGKVEFAVNF